MINRRILLSLTVLTSLLVAAGLAVAKNEHHNSGHNLLGGKINQNGKHEIHKIGNNSVVAEVNNKKIVNMSAGSLPVRKVKSNKKMAAEGVLGGINVAANGDIRLAQLTDVYYAYCFDTGLDVYCYWYPASDVIVTDTWEPY
jgi:hypothetical protein